MISERVLFQVSSWGGYVFLINLIPLHVLVLMATGRFSHRTYVAYSTVSVTIKAVVGLMTDMNYDICQLS